VLCFDDETYDILSHLGLPGMRLISEGDFEHGDTCLLEAKADRTRVEYYWTCTPSLPLYVLEHNPEVDVITYLDADLCFFYEPRSIYEELGDGSILIVGHRYAPEHAHLATTCGLYNVGLMAFRRDESALACLRWWRERCLEWCHVRCEAGRFGDQKYLDDWPERFQGVIVLKNRGAGLAPWNLTQYQISFDVDVIKIDAVPLIFYHYHGFRYVNRWVCQPAAPGYSMPRIGSMSLFDSYVRSLRKARQMIRNTTSLPSPSTHRRPVQSVIRGLLRGELLWVGPGPLASFFSWTSGQYERQTRHLEQGFAAQANGNLAAARFAFLAAIRCNPLLLSNLGIVSVLVESWLGSEVMTRYRRWRHGGPV
jgi:hypothetical protein